ncbi:MAG: SEC-C metal-binding domain-containing protein [Acutalibacteraceae bacterium]
MQQCFVCLCGSGRKFARGYQL